MDKEDIVPIHSGILLSHKKENLAICDNLGKPLRHYAKWNKTEEEKWHISLSM